MISATKYPAFSRNFEDEQDYADAAVSAARKANPLAGGLSLSPVLRWNRRQRQGQQDRGSSFKCKTLVVGFEGGGASFAQKCFGLGTDDAEWIGTVVLPGTTSTTGGVGDSLDPSDPLNTACNIFLKKGRGIGSGSDLRGSVGSGESSSSSGSNGTAAGTSGGREGEGLSNPSPPNAFAASNNDANAEGGGVVVVLCGYCVPPRQADAWANALLSGIDAEVVVVLTTVVPEPGRSEGWPGARLVATAEAEEREDCLKMSVGFQPLRTPTMLSGASAALVSYCQRHGRAAMCFAAAELPGARRVIRLRLPQPHQQQQQVGGGGSGGVGGGSLRMVERSLSCTRKPLSMVAGEAMAADGIDRGSGGGDDGGGGAENEIDAVSSASSLYI